MKKTLFALVALAAAGSAMASSTNPFARDIVEPVAVKSPYTFELGLTTHREVYKEYNPDGSKLMQEEAWMTGIKGGVTREFADIGGKVVLTGEFAMGRSDYTGSYWGGNYGDLHVNNLDRTLFEVTGMYKQSAPMWNGLSAGAGLGYRRLVDNLQQGPGGYKRTNDRVYLVVGLEQAFELKNWTITPGVQYKHILSGKQRSDLWGGITHKQDGYGAEASIAFVHKGDKYNTVVTPYYRLWDIKDSNVDYRTGTYEPRNKTKEFGVALTFQF
ncbi:hypothetical protein [Burkholderia ubonensis]|uniref:hypothetical protein n=1 Tax=Burkholderia ubonensis TaxID=101571 RepID=UPI00076CFE2E|nr:hypothetical protein [Burkholderia ubonensis]KVP17188.1 hypothetical protein WJ84_02600 [Burkholderia ubonensis]